MHGIRDNYRKVPKSYRMIKVANEAVHDNKFCNNQVRSCELPIQKGGRYYGNVDILGPDGRYHSINALIDSGNDITILTRSTSESIGFNPDAIKSRFYVKGINGEAREFSEVPTKIKPCGNFTPMDASIGLAIQQDSLSDNLLGRSGIFDSGKIEVIYDSDSITFREKTKGVCGI